MNWTEYTSNLPWPEGDRVKWEVMDDGEWKDTLMPTYWWGIGHRVRYHFPRTDEMTILSRDAWEAYARTGKETEEELFKDGFERGWSKAKEAEE